MTKVPKTPLLPRKVLVWAVQTQCWAEVQLTWGCRYGPGPPKPTTEHTLSTGIIILTSVTPNILSGCGESQGKLRFGASAAKVAWLVLQPVSRVGWSGKVVEDH